MTVLEFIKTRDDYWRATSSHDEKLEAELKEKVLEYNDELVKNYPFLESRNVWDDEPPEDNLSTWLDDMPDGWRIAFGNEMCEKIKQALLSEGGEKMLNDYRLQQVKEKFGCYDEKTEVLTKAGWKFLKDVTYEDEIAALDIDGKTLIYEHPIDIISYNYNGKMYYLNNRGINLCVTPNHNLYVSKGSYFCHKKNNEKRVYPYEFTTPDKYFGKDKRFKKGATWNGITPPSKFIIQGYTYTNTCKNFQRTYKKDDISFDIVPFLKFLGFYIAEGHSSHRKGCGSDIRIAYNPYTEEELVTRLIEDIGFVPEQAGRGLKRFSNVTLTEWLLNNCGHLAWNKKVPNFIKELSPKYIEIFLEYLFIGDGHKTKTSNILTTTSKQLSDDVQELLIKCGYTFRETFHPVINGTKNKNGIKSPNDKHNITGKHDIYCVSWLKLTEIEIDNSKTKNTPSFKEEWIDYNGMVYCLTLPNHLMYVRREGKGCWCGNSLRWYSAWTTDKVEDIVRKYEDLSWRTCIHCGKPSKYYTTGWIAPYCEDCANRIWNNYKERYNDVQFDRIFDDIEKGGI